VERSLRVLRLVKDAGVDGLSATEISKLLTDKFRVRTSRRGVALALDAAGRFVDRDKSSRQVTYRIMAAGERHLDTPRQESSQERSSEKRKSISRASKKRKSKKDGASVGKPARGRPGPKAAVQALITDGYFSEPRTIGDIQERLRTKRGHTYKATDLSPALARLLRDGQLDRERNDDGHFEYNAK
jgi:chromatin remodeling complex protein RSC6